MTKSNAGRVVGPFSDDEWAMEARATRPPLIHYVAVALFVVALALLLIGIVVVAGVLS